MDPKEPSNAELEVFNSPDADVVFCSSDNVLFRIHTSNLEFGSDGFPPLEIRPQEDEIVSLPEKSIVLELLFRFVYPRILPDLDELGFATLAALGKATEKYQVHVGRKQCSLYLERHVDSNPLYVLNYAMMYGYPKLANAAAPKVMFHKLSDKKYNAALCREVFEHYTPYYYRWLNLVRTTTSEWSQTTHDSTVIVSAFGHSTVMPSSGFGHSAQRCSSWENYQQGIFAAILPVVGPDWNISRLINLPANAPSCCQAQVKKWKTDLEAKLKEISLFVES
ncbi:hypothetical protein H0H92_014737 [Tricholoma furcatifolium]|nr:hypothetical protein H0H92_014737 [Tricholoma furcatifolium]